MRRGVAVDGTELAEPFPLPEPVYIDQVQSLIGTTFRVVYNGGGIRESQMQKNRGTARCRMYKRVEKTVKGKRAQSNSKSFTV